MKFACMLSFLCILSAAAEPPRTPDAEPFSPSSVSGLTLWLDANDVDGDGIPEADGEDGLVDGWVARWQDKSSRRIALEQAEAGHRPVFGIGVQNSREVVTFGDKGMLSYMSNPQAVLGEQSEAVTWYVVFRPSVVSSVYPVWAVMGGYAGGLIRDGEAMGRIEFGRNHRDKVRSNRNVLSEAIVFSALLTPKGEDCLEGFLNGEPQGAGSDPFFSPGRLGGQRTGVQLGSDNPRFLFDGDVMEVLVYNRALSGAERKQIDAHLIEKWGLRYEQGDAAEDGTPAGLKPFRMYLSGNSLTGQTVIPGHPEFLTHMKTKGLHLTIGRDTRGGSSISWRYENGPRIPFKPFGYNVEALSNFEWDVVSFQPYGLYKYELAAIRKYMDIIAEKSPNAAVLLYELYPKSDRFDDFDEGWNHELDLSLDMDDAAARNYSAQTRNYFEAMYRDMVGYAREKGYANPVRLVPVGQVMERLHHMMKVGEVPGFTDIRQLHSDGVHHNDFGGWMDSLVFYAVMFKEDPADFPIIPKAMYRTRVGEGQMFKDTRTMDEVADIFRRVVWDVVRERSTETGVE